MCRTVWSSPGSRRDPRGPNLSRAPVSQNDRSFPEPDILFVQVSFEVLVDTDPDPFGTGDDTKDSRFAVPDVDGIGKHVEDGKIVFNNDDRTQGARSRISFAAAILW
jgi:hypothetical protein